MKLTAKQQKFVDAYLATRDVILSGEEAGIKWCGPLKSYVYFLVDPLSKQIFYIGKGTGSRAKQHARQEELKRPSENCKKDQIIQRIKKAGQRTKALIFEAGMDKGQSLSLEAILIRCLGDAGITNVQKMPKGSLGKTLLNAIGSEGVSELTDRQQRFVDVYDGDIKSASGKSGLSYGYCRRLVTKGNILSAIKDRHKGARSLRIASREDREKFWTDVMEDPTNDMKDRLKSSELLGRANAHFTDKIQADMSLKIVRKEYKQK